MAAIADWNFGRLFRPVPEAVTRDDARPMTDAALILPCTSIRQIINDDKIAVIRAVWRYRQQAAGQDLHPWQVWTGAVASTDNDELHVEWEQAPDMLYVFPDGSIDYSKVDVVSHQVGSPKKPREDDSQQQLSLDTDFNPDEPATWIPYLERGQKDILKLKLEFYFLKNAQNTNVQRKVLFQAINAFIEGAASCNEWEKTSFLQCIKHLVTAIKYQIVEDQVPTRFSSPGLQRVTSIERELTKNDVAASEFARAEATVRAKFADRGRGRGSFVSGRAKCEYCGKFGHKEIDCFKKRDDGQQDRKNGAGGANAKAAAK